MKYYDRVQVMNEMAKIETTNVDGNQMQVVLMGCEVDGEPKKIPFIGFDRRKMALTVEPDSVGSHHHLRIYLEGEHLGYCHLDAKGITFWASLGGHTRLFFKDAIEAKTKYE